MSTYSQCCHAKQESGWGDFLGFMFSMFCIWLVASLIKFWGVQEERGRIGEMLKPYGVTIEHLEEQDKIAKAKKMAEPINMLCQQGTCTSAVEKSK